MFILKVKTKYYIISRTVPLPEHILKEISDWAVERSLAFLFKTYKAKPSLYKKYNVTQIKGKLKEKHTELKKVMVTQKDLTVGTLKKDEIRLVIGAVNMLAQNKGAYAIFIPKDNLIGVYQPWSFHGQELNQQTIDIYVKDLRDGIKHEFIHFIQANTEEGIGGKNKDGESYWTSHREYKPQLESAVNRFINELYLLDIHKKKIERKHLLQFVGLKEYRPKIASMLGDVITDDLFFSLKKKDSIKWKKTIKDFIALLKKSPDFHYKSILLGE